MLGGGRLMCSDTTVVGWGSATCASAAHRVNEDASLAGPAVFAVADGMGGHLAGARASEMVIARLAEVGPPPVDADAVAEAVAAANRAIHESGTASADLRGMGTTLSGLALVREGPRDLWLVFNVGDSRVYRLHEGVLTQVTRDHSEVQELVDSGQITPDDAARHDRRNVLTRALGPDPRARVDFQYLVPVEGERFVVCTDGVTTTVTDDEIRRLMSLVKRPDEAARSLVAVAAGPAARDDISAVLVDTVRAQSQALSADTIVPLPRTKAGEDGPG
jgi:PPM family protein phosphatase